MQLFYIRRSQGKRRERERRHGKETPGGFSGREPHYPTLTLAVVATLQQQQAAAQAVLERSMMGGHDEAQPPSRVARFLV